ncbi:MAG: hypothetical protein COA79_07630 [Planctomycetota bacterium]|nr:MAG: hypothetical protein COA79_07630 [Planctomycetota bacterium]
MELKIIGSVYEKLIEISREGIPNEICGYLSGADDVCEELHQLENISDTPEVFFNFNPKDQFAVTKEIREKGTKFLVCFHSHPIGGESLSKDDKKLLIDKSMKYIIVSLRLSVPVVNAWSFDGEEYKPLTISILEK